MKRSTYLLSRKCRRVSKVILSGALKVGLEQSTSNREGRYKLHLPIKNNFSIAIENAEDIRGDQHRVKALV